MVKSPIDRGMWQQRCEQWQRRDGFQLEVDWSKSTWWKPQWSTIEEPYKHTILFRLARQLRNERNGDPLQVHHKYFYYEASADEYTEDFIIDFGALTQWDLQTLCVRHVRVVNEVLKNTTRYQ